MQKIKVGFDISQIAHTGGVGIYTHNITEELSKDPNLEMKYFYSSLRIPYRGKLENVKKYKFPPTFFEFIFNHVRSIPIENFIGEVDIFHSSDWVQPASRAKKVTTYHDVVPLKFPNWSHPKVVAVHKKRLEIVEREIDMVIAVTESTKRDLVEVSQIPAEKITVVYEGVSNKFVCQDEKDIASFRQKYQLPEKFILAIGGVGTRRNMDRIKDVCKDQNLIITGENIPFIPVEELPLLYASSQVLLYPSFYEGFGLPIVEAMATGIPVITSNVSSMPEVGGEAVLLVDPENEKDISNKLLDVLRDNNLRSIMIKKGLEQAKKFSWEKCAKETADVYKKILKRSL